MLEPESGTEKAFESVRMAPRNTQRAIELAFYHVGRNLIKELSRQMLAKDKRGRVYLRRDKAGRRRRHTASAPGQTAANRTGNMRKNRTFTVRGSEQLEFGIKSGARYAEFLERGTRRIKPRPSLDNTVKAAEKDTTNSFLHQLERALR